MASATEIINVLCLFCATFVRLKTERPVLDRPLKVGGGIQPRLVTVLTPATTFTVGEDFSQKGRAVNRVREVIYYFYLDRQNAGFLRLQNFAGCQSIFR